MKSQDQQVMLAFVTSNVKDLRLRFGQLVDQVSCVRVDQQSLDLRITQLLHMHNGMETSTNGTLQSDGGPGNAATSPTDMTMTSESIEPMAVQCGLDWLETHLKKLRR